MPALTAEMASWLGMPVWAAAEEKNTTLQGWRTFFATARVMAKLLLKCKLTKSYQSDSEVALEGLSQTEPKQLMTPETG